MKDSCIAKKAGASGRRRSVLLAVVVAAVWTATILVGGCTSDPANIVGVDLIDNQIDSTLVSLEIVAIDAFAGLRVDDADELLQDLPTLYMGSEGDVRASFVVNYDMADIFTDDHPAEDFTLDNIKTVKLRLLKYLPYAAEFDTIYDTNADGDTLGFSIEPNGQPQDLYYEAFELVEPFDNASVSDYPATVPSIRGSQVNDNYLDPIIGNEPFLDIDKTTFLRWVASGEKVGLLVRFGAASDAGLVGFASQEWKKAGELPSVGATTNPAPTLNIDFKVTAADSNELNRVLAPDTDATIFETIPEAPSTKPEAADGFVLRTGLRSYPAFRFDLSALPENVIVNRAVLAVVNDTSLSFGPTFSVMVSEIVAETMDDPTVRMDVSAISDVSQVYPLNFRSNLSPKEDELIEFDITLGIQRAINLVNEEPRGFLLSGIEKKSAFPVPIPDVTGPNYYYRQLNFKGLNDPDPDNRPKLKVWYSVIDELSGVGN